MNSLEELLNLYPKYEHIVYDEIIDWMFGLLSDNPNLTWKIIQQNLDCNWNWNKISHHSNITWQIIRNNRNLPWNFMNILQNPNITLEIVYENLKLFWEFTKLSKQPYHSWEVIKLDVNVTCGDFFKNVITHLEIVKQRPHLSYLSDFVEWEQSILSIFAFPCWKHDQYDRYCCWDFDELSEHPHLTWDIIKSFPIMSWDWLEISRHPCITWEIIQQHPKYPWDWDALSRHPCITWQIVQDNPKSWELCKIAQNPNTPSDIIALIVKEYGDNVSDLEESSVESNVDSYEYRPMILVIKDCLFTGNANNLNWFEISKHPNLKWEIVVDNIDLPWEWEEISKNPNITWDIVVDNIDLPWEWDEISLNPNITWEIVDNNDKSWDYYEMSSNTNMCYEIVIENLWKGWWFELICPCHNTWNELQELGLNGKLTYQEYKQLE